ncbi:MAG: response regulator [Myxococcota bacterium]|jgi:PleD family two-component response regulator|nr:response regulator [Myxococcota bacterium]
MAAPGEAGPFDDSRLAMLIVDPDGSICRANARARELLGLAAAASTQTRDANLHDLVCEPSEMELAEHLACACGMGRSDASDMLMQRTDRTSFWARVRSQVAGDGDEGAADTADSVRVLLIMEAIEDPMADMERLFAKDPVQVFQTSSVRRTRVMIVDDDIPALAENTALLESLGHQVMGFSDPKLALEEFALRAADYDAVIVDDEMPPIEGLVLCRALLEVRYEVPVLLVSSEGSKVDVASAIAVGVDQVLAKPLESDELSQWLRGAARGSL